MKQKTNGKFSAEDIKKIIEDIEQEERINSNFKGILKGFTTIEYYKDSFKNKNFSLTAKISSLATPLTSEGIYNFENATAVVFLSSNNKIINPNEQILELIKTCYHEIRHSIQDNLNPFSFIKFTSDIDNLIAYYDYSLYKKRHDYFYFEIDANSYSIKKAKEYLEKKLPDIYKLENIKKDIKDDEKYYSTIYTLFDIGNSIEKTIELLKRHNISKEEKDDISPVLNIFLNSNNSFKSIEQIFTNKNIDNIDKKIICAFLSNRTFLENIDFNNLNYYELQILNDALQYTIELYIKQQQIINTEQKKHKEKLDFYSKKQNNIIKKIYYLYNCKSLINELNNIQLDTSKKYKLHKKKLPEYLEKINYLLKNKE